VKTQPAGAKSLSGPGAAGQGWAQSERTRAEGARFMSAPTTEAAPSDARRGTEEPPSAADGDRVRRLPIPGAPVQRI
jgi:hypothetical protein